MNDSSEVSAETGIIAGTATMPRITVPNVGGMPLAHAAALIGSEVFRRFLPELLEKRLPTAAFN